MFAIQMLSRQASSSLKPDDYSQVLPYKYSGAFHDLFSLHSEKQPKDAHFMSKHELLSLDPAKCHRPVGFPKPSPWCIARVTLSNEPAGRGEASWGVHQVCLSHMQTSERLAFKSDLQIGYALHFGLASNLNSTVVISVLASYAFWWRPWKKFQYQKILC